MLEALAHEHIVDSAILGDDGKIHRPYPEDSPGRHHHIIRRMAREKGSTIGTQGFVTNEGRFLNRTDAAKLALSIGQVKTLETPPELFSEDLW